MSRIPLALVALAALLAGCLDPQPFGTSPYVGQDGSEVRGLTPQEIEDLRTGAGMGLARPAELNGWPGPLHALELADELALDAPQRHDLRVLRQEMLDEAVPLGEKILDVHARLEAGFRDGSMDAARLNALLVELEAVYAALRFVHLSTHLEAADVFTPEQRHEYMRLRGYTTDGMSEGHDHASRPEGHGA